MNIKTKSAGSKRVSSPSKMTIPTKPPKRKKTSRQNDSPPKTITKPLKKITPNKKLAKQHDQVIHFIVFVLSTQNRRNWCVLSILIFSISKVFKFQLRDLEKVYLEK